MKKILFVLLLITLIAVACTPTPQPTEQPLLPNEDSYPSDSQTGRTPAEQAAVEALSQALNLPPGQITLISSEAVEWRDGCLEIQKPDMFCTQAIVPGYKIILQAGGELYEIRTNKDGTQAVQAMDPVTFTTVEEKVMHQLAGNLGLDSSEVTLVSSTDVEFGDACLGVLLPEVQCAQVVVPGKLIVLSVNDMEYEYHVSTDGTFIQPASIALTWKREGGIAGFCDSLTVFRSGEVYGNQCKSQPGPATSSFASLLTEDELDQFGTWIEDLGDVEIDASDPKGVSDRMTVSLQFNGLGKGSLNDKEKQELLLWAQTVFQKLYS